jgi:hypothetical protein
LQAQLAEKDRAIFSESELPLRPELGHDGILLYFVPTPCAPFTGRVAGAFRAWARWHLALPRQPQMSACGGMLTFELKQGLGTATTLEEKIRLLT